MGSSSFSNTGKPSVLSSSFLSPPSRSSLTKNSVSFSPVSSQPRCCYNSRNSNEGPLNNCLEYHDILGVSPNCSAPELKAAFRAKVKQFHPDVNRDGESSDEMIRLVIEAYEMLSNYSKSEVIEGECLDPFDKPECEAFDLFVNETLCIGVGCPYSCVKRAPHAFSFSSSTRTARAAAQGQIFALWTVVLLCTGLIGTTLRKTMKAQVFRPSQECGSSPGGHPLQGQSRTTIVGFDFTCGPAFHLLQVEAQKGWTTDQEEYYPFS